MELEALFGLLYMRGIMQANLTGSHLNTSIALSNLKINLDFSCFVTSVLIFHITITLQKSETYIIYRMYCRI